MHKFGHSCRLEATRSVTMVLFDKLYANLWAMDMYV